MSEESNQARSPQGSKTAIGGRALLHVVPLAWKPPARFGLGELNVRIKGLNPVGGLGNAHNLFLGFPGGPRCDVVGLLCARPVRTAWLAAGSPVPRLPRGFFTLRGERAVGPFGAGVDEMRPPSFLRFFEGGGCPGAWAAGTPVAHGSDGSLCLPFCLAPGVPWRRFAAAAWRAAVVIDNEEFFSWLELPIREFSCVTLVFAPPAPRLPGASSPRALRDALRGGRVDELSRLGGMLRGQQSAARVVELGDRGWALGGGEPCA
ncbi:hypothetical protein CYMTET_54515 [Cymbomonas tetramitiformis]|uniref:Uncharacterized protein n=1 Tax=Cymbomonas tetramitiformis TaxID=36881 RepID=A0AAE0ENM7_9CHLO|nr:hypothetical protein CYMTET_54515 [Cymbomonas tetramitiformis]